MKSCCLDPACARRLHKRIWLHGQQVELEDDESRLNRFLGWLMSDGVQSFLVQLLNAASISTQWFDCGFASIRQWLFMSSKPLSTATLFAKYVCHHFDRLHEAVIEAASDIEERRATTMGRPAWAQSSNPRLNGYHLHVATALKDGLSLSGCSDSWQKVEVEKRAEYSMQAHLRNQQDLCLRLTQLRDASSDFAHEDEGPWGLGDSMFAYSLQRLHEDGYCVGSESRQRGSVQKHVKSWKDRDTCVTL